MENDHSDVDVRLPSYISVFIDDQIPALAEGGFLARERSPMSNIAILMVNQRRFIMGAITVTTVFLSWLT